MLTSLSLWAASKFGSIGGKLFELIVALILLLMLVGGPYYLGWTHRGDSDAAKQATAAKIEAQQTTHAVVVEYQRRDDNATKAVTADSKAEGNAQAHTQQLHQEVIRYVTANPTSACSLDADGMRIWRAANAGDPAASDAAGVADPAVPGPSAAVQPAAGGSAGQPRHGGGSVLPVPGAAPGPQ